MILQAGLRYFSILWALLIVLVCGVLFSPGAVAAGRGELEAVLAGIEKRYSGPGFEAEFFQHSTLKAMDISDSAQGRIWVKRPGKMRWEYLKPEKQTVVTDGDKLWIYRPRDNQVMVGRAPDMFARGKGAAFLSSMEDLRSNFAVSLGKSANPDYWRVKLVPRKNGSEIAQIVISVSRRTFQADQIVTLNRFGDETRIVIRNYKFKADLSDRLFQFSPPAGVEVVELQP